ncbi:tigA [[Candida] subhashii]|uniref:TigA n=1 Tax=[Candida] subhashii TaxID=561895 RepID=A0A8J5URL3_9ASCO|nr:tigA [[Candida] subhashii]KAG7664742.1 tigA [[Candida] subhashii]
MRFINLLTLASISFILHPVLSAYSPVSLLQANDANFKSLVVNSDKFSLVEIYADWCRHCNKLHPIFEQLSDMFIDVSDQIQIVKVNGDKDGKKVARKYVDKGFPTILFFYGKGDDKNRVEFEGVRDLEGLSNFVQQLSGVRLIKGNKEKEEEEVTSGELEKKIVIDQKKELVRLSPDNFDDIVGKSPASVVVFGASWCSHCQDLKPTLEILATKVYARDNNLLIGHYQLDEFEGNEFWKRYDVESLPTILFFKDGDVYNPLVYKGKRKLEILVENINGFAKLNRDAEGKLIAGTGIIPEINEMIKQVQKDSSFGSEGLKILEKLDELIDVDEESKEYYRKLIDLFVINKKNTNQLQIELNRIQTILNKDSNRLDTITLDSLQKRSNILGSLV